jgi:hypothetical protein
MDIIFTFSHSKDSTIKTVADKKEFQKHNIKYENDL